ncbi:MAG: GNAT family N-acetyltransferase [Nitrososphaeria archaeon]|nr:GNAT family N-acetyltransferase [Nitrososphaeria archaeon]
MKIRCELKPGDIGEIIKFHGITYSKEYGYDLTFEAYVAEGLAEFIKSYSAEKDCVWIVEDDKKIIGCIAVFGRSKDCAQIRWFLVHPEYRGKGLGKKLLEKAIEFCKNYGYRNIYLWTTSELAVAKKLYTGFGFVKTEEKKHRIWGKDIVEEKYELRVWK